MIEKETLQLKSVATGIERVKEPKAGQSPEEFVIRVKVFNPEGRTLYAYSNPRRVLYDNATHKLTICLHDEHVDEKDLKWMHLKQPHFKPLEGNTETEITLNLPPVIQRIRPAAERGNGPLTEELRISEATEINVEIAHQDTPFYYNPKINMGKQLKEWGRNVSRVNFKVTPQKPKESS